MLIAQAFDVTVWGIASNWDHSSIVFRIVQYSCPENNTCRSSVNTSMIDLDSSELHAIEKPLAECQGLNGLTGRCIFQRCIRRAVALFTRISRVSLHR